MRTEKEEREIERRLAKLNALEAGGVDNWDWYDESLKGWRKENELDELIDSLVDEINEVLVDAEVEQPAGPDSGYSVRLPDGEARQFIAMVINRYNSIKDDEDD